jgi:hypothetical protein
MRLLIVAGLVVGGAVLVASLEFFSRSARRLMVEPNPGSFHRRRPAAGPARPVGLVQLEQLVAEALAGPGAARARLIEQLAALGAPLPGTATPQQLVDAVAELARAAGEVRPAEGRR